MRKVLVILALTIATVAFTAGDAFAQRRGGYGGRGSGWSISIGSGYYGGNYGRGYVSPYYGSSYYAQPYYAQPYYYESAPVVQVPATELRQSFYSEPAAVQSAMIIVLLPRADARVWFDGAATTQQGMERTFNSPPLDRGSNYSYTIRARWLENGQEVERSRTVNVQPGQSFTVYFRGETGENLQTLPRSK